ncbi:universal stress protein [Paeniglutamicibacter cryotolerans]|uniref:Nucleotide-binding universal stress UspA family protein n=2 Tax=Paeniglutamicibacter cryotolerans TaxID=670079 RepID=A0A839QJF7_9MICC|nr:universal stress protein [Paeniglutamicibacter cryotolerans]MBB2996329.1 nucleotide-binding universal stress UspA family protein [Paeniglutamicibacter cryotolerans]
MTGPIVAGIMPGQPLAVVRHCAALASGLNVGIVFVYVDASRYLVKEKGDTSALIDPDGIDEPGDGDRLIGLLRQRIDVELAGTAIDWALVSEAGEPARSLNRLADRVQASVILVGTRERGVEALLEELVMGSVAVHLAHHQARPVMIVPLDPQPEHERL